MAQVKYYPEPNETFILVKDGRRLGLEITHINHPTRATFLLDIFTANGNHPISTKNSLTDYTVAVYFDKEEG